MNTRPGILIAVFLLLLLVACEPERENCVHIADSSECGLHYIHETKSMDKLKEILTRDATIDSINRHVGLDYIKRYYDGYLSVVKTEEGLILLRFTAKGNYRNAEKIVLTGTLTEEMMNSITPGMTVADVTEIDPNGFYLYKYTSSSFARKDSYHYTGSGVCYEIIYDENLIVTEVRSYLL